MIEKEVYMILGGFVFGVSITLVLVVLFLQDVKKTIKEFLKIEGVELENQPLPNSQSNKSRSICMRIILAKR